MNNVKGKTILHSDLNSFYASVECLYNPLIRNLPVIVSGDQDARHGIVLTKNLIAKKHGIITGEAVWQAKQKCPELVVVQADYSKYIKISKVVKDIYYDYTDQTESFGIDESWLDVTGSLGLFGSRSKIAEEIRQRVYREIGITVSIGVSFNKIFAKLGSDMKKPNAVTVITQGNFKNTVWRLPVSELLYVGRSTAGKLRKINIKTIGDLANYDLKHLYTHFGKRGIVLNRFANGLDDSPVTVRGAGSYIKSMGNSTTTTRDMTTVEEVKAVLYMLSESVAARLREQKLKCSTVQIDIRDKNLVSCDRQGKIEYPTYLSTEIADKVLEIFVKKYQHKTPLRSIGIRGTCLVSENTDLQMSLFADHAKRKKQESLEKTVDKIRERFGYHSIEKGILMVDKSLTGINAKDEHTIHPLNYFDGIIT